MSIAQKIRKLEAALGGTTNLYDLDFISARDDESLTDAVSRVARERGLELKDVGHAMVLWSDDDKLDRSEEYRHPTVRSWDDVEKLIGHKRHEQWLEELD